MATSEQWFLKSCVMHKMPSSSLSRAPVRQKVDGTSCDATCIMYVQKIPGVTWVLSPAGGKSIQHLMSFSAFTFGHGFLLKPELHNFLSVSLVDLWPPPRVI